MHHIHSLGRIRTGRHHLDVDLPRPFIGTLLGCSTLAGHALLDDPTHHWIGSSWQAKRRPQEGLPGLPGLLHSARRASQASLPPNSAFQAGCRGLLAPIFRRSWSWYPSSIVKKSHKLWHHIKFKRIQQLGYLVPCTLRLPVDSTVDLT